MAGRRPLPTAVKKLRGNPGKRKLNADETKVKLEAPTMPENLPELAQAEWKSIVPELMQLGVLSSIDGKALAAYCYCFSRWIEAENEIADRGILIEETIYNKDGEEVGYRIKRNPAIPVVNEALRQMKSFLIEFGLSPASRSRLKIEKPAADVDPFDAFLSRGSSSTPAGKVN